MLVRVVCILSLVHEFTGADEPTHFPFLSFFQSIISGSGSHLCIHPHTSSSATNDRTTQNHGGLRPAPAPLCRPSGGLPPFFELPPEICPFVSLVRGPSSCFRPLRSIGPCPQPLGQGCRGPSARGRTRTRLRGIHQIHFVTILTFY